MTKRKNATRISLAEFKARRRDDEALIIDTDDGGEFVVDPSVLWPDEAMALLAANDIVGAARAIIGDRYDAFIAAGGSAAILAAIIEEHAGGTLGESPASSD